MTDRFATKHSAKPINTGRAAKREMGKQFLQALRGSWGFCPTYPATLAVLMACPNYLRAIHNFGVDNIRLFISFLSKPISSVTAMDVLWNGETYKINEKEKKQVTVFSLYSYRECSCQL